MSADTPKRRHKTHKPPLSAREVRFCQKYVETGNGTRSVIDAGFPHIGENAAHNHAIRLLRKPTIRLYCRDLQHAAAVAAQVTINDLVRDFQTHRRADFRKILGPDGQVLPPSQWPDDVAQYIARIEVEQMFDWQEVDGKSCRIEVGRKWKVWLEGKSESRRILAEFLRMTGRDADAGATAHAPLVVGGEADPGKL